MERPMNSSSNNGNGNDGRTVRIGGASGFWGDSSVGAPQLVASGQIDYLVFDYLAELTMSILAGARLKKPELGYATDFVSVAMKAVLKDVVEQGIRVVSNAGGVNPQGCADALAALAAEQGIALKIAVVSGDDVSALLPQLRQSQPPVRELHSGAALPARVLTANAYLGARPVQAALDAGAQVVITGRCVDSAVTLGVLMHEFRWQPGDFDLLAAGSLAGHIIECGCQATGGLHTDWDTVPDWPNIGYPIVECAADGGFVVTKPANTGGKLTPAVVGEQMLYEIGDPAAYLLPDVVADFTQVRIEQAGEHRVRVRGAKGRAPTAQLQGERHLRRGLQDRGAAHHRGLRRGGQGPAHGRGDPGAHRRAVRATRLRPLQRHAARGARRRVVLRAACADAGAAHARGRAAARGDASAQGGAGTVRARGGARRHLVGAGHHRRGRRARVGVAVDPAVRLPARQAAGAGGGAHRRRAHRMAAKRGAGGEPRPRPRPRPRPTETETARPTKAVRAGTPERNDAPLAPDAIEVPLIRLAWACPPSSTPSRPATCTSPTAS
jgi:hypothetical protein